MTLADTVEVETPELVVVSYTVAGVASRANAALIDYLICLLAFIVMGVVLAAVLPRNALTITDPESVIGWVVAVIALAQFVVLWGYYVLFEAIADGQTPGKRAMKLRVVRDGGLSVTFGASAVRNLVRILDMQPGFFYGVGLTSVIAQREGKRLGDIAAGTLVVREEVLPAPLVMAAAEPAGDEPVVALQAALTDAEYDVLERFARRRTELDPAVREALAAQLAGRFAPALVTFESRTPTSRLLQLHAAEQQARAQGVAARHDTGAARERHAIVATNAPRWTAFASRLTEAQRGGLRTLGEDGVRAFVQDYRDLTADLARLRTATKGSTSAEVFYLNRLVASAHNLLYRRRAIPLGDVGRYLFVEVPREIRASATPVLLAATLLFAPMILTAVTVARDPKAAEALLPPQMFDRAEDGVRAAAAGDGYIDVPEIYRPTLASRLISNNVQVAFLAFAAGITAGVLTAWVLVMNGVSIGAMFGLYASKDISGLLFAFVAPHGVLELSAIAIAGGAGLLLGAGILLPGDRTRRRALVENGRRAITLVAGAAMLLVVAGVIEGFISPIPHWPLALKLVVSGFTAVGLYVFLRLGARRARPVAADVA